jgi:hypothetical protein
MLMRGFASRHAATGKPGLRYLDDQGSTIPW